jgi:hypothetical protein
MDLSTPAPPSAARFRHIRAGFDCAEPGFKRARHAHLSPYVSIVVGYTDQAHMTRAVRTLTGAPPGAWRRHLAERRPCLKNGAGHETGAV